MTRTVPALRRTAVAAAVVLLHAALGLALVSAVAGLTAVARPAQAPAVLWVGLPGAGPAPTPAPPPSQAVRVAGAGEPALRPAAAAQQPARGMQAALQTAVQTAAEAAPPATSVTTATTATTALEAALEQAQAGDERAVWAVPPPGSGGERDTLTHRPGDPPSAEPTAAAHASTPARPRAHRTEPDHGLCPPARHPAALRERGIEGEVHLRVLVGADGRAREVQVAHSSGWRLFDEAARVQAQRCRFMPATEDGTPVDRWVTYPVLFGLASAVSSSRHAASPH